MLNFALVGCGRIAKRHSELLGHRQIAGARLSAVCDVVPERAEAIVDLLRRDARMTNAAIGAMGSGTVYVATLVPRTGIEFCPDSFQPFEYDLGAQAVAAGVARGVFAHGGVHHHQLQLGVHQDGLPVDAHQHKAPVAARDRKSTRLNSSHRT